MAGIHINGGGSQLRRTYSEPINFGKGKEKAKLSDEEETKLAKKKAKHEAEVKAQVKAQAADKKQARADGAGPSKKAESPKSPASSKTLSRSSSLGSLSGSEPGTPTDRRIAKWLAGQDKATKHPAPVAPRQPEIQPENEGPALSRSGSQASTASNHVLAPLDFPAPEKKSNLKRNLGIVAGAVVGGGAGFALAPFLISNTGHGEPGGDSVE